MTGNKLLKASAGLGLAAGVVVGGPVRAEAVDAAVLSSLARQEASGVERVRRHVDELKRKHGRKAEPAVLRTEGDEAAEQPWWQAAFPGAPAPAAGGAKVIQAQATGEQMSRAAEVPPGPAAEDAPGVLTREGVLVVEPSIDYQHTDINRFVVGGVAILDTVLVGQVEATQANRDAVTATLGLRYGITNRFEAELRVPYMYRHDSTTNTVVNTNNTLATTNLSDGGLGDVEAALHYQINDGQGQWPFFVGNIRVKTPTGKGPFDVKRDTLGVERELATGSGFWGVEPSITVIAPSDPAVFYANLGYLWNVKDHVGKQVSSNQYIDEVDPGDAIRVGLGMGIALNEKVSFSLGYQHDWIMGTTTRFASGDFKSASLSVGTMTVGVNYQMTPDTAINVSVGVGVTNDAPDMHMMVRVPIALKVL